MNQEETRNTAEHFLYDSWLKLALVGEINKNNSFPIFIRMSSAEAQKICRIHINGAIVTGEGDTEEEARENVLKKVKEMVHHSPVIPSGEMLTTVNSAYSGSGRPTNANMVGRLQELCVSKHWPLPVYNLLDSQGPSHMPHFLMACSVRDLVAVGNGKTKKEAKHNAAQKLLELLRDGGHQDRGSVPVVRVPPLCAPSMLRRDEILYVERRTYQNTNLRATETFKAYRERSPLVHGPLLALKEKEERSRSLSPEKVSPSISEVQSESSAEPIPLPSVEDYLCGRFQDQMQLDGW